MTNVNNFKVARFLYYAGCLTLCQLTIRPALSLTLSDWLFFGSIIAVVVEIILLNRNIELRLSFLFLFSCLIFIAGGLLSLLNMNDKVTVLSVIVRFIYITIVWFWLGTMVLRTKNHIKRASLLWLLSLTITCTAAVLQLLDPHIIPGSEPHQGRMLGFTSHPNDLGAMSAIGWGAACAMLATSRILINKALIRYCLIFTILAGLMLSGSTGSALAAIASTGIWLFLSGSIRRWVWIVLLVVTFTIPILAVQHLSEGKSIFHRLNKTINPNTHNATLWSRIENYKIALKEIKRNPIIGVGFARGGHKTKMGLSVHNVYLAALYEAGLFGFIGLVALSLSSILSAHHMLARIRRCSTEQYLAIGFSAASVGFLVYAMGSPVLYQRYGWISLSLLFSLRAVIHRNLKLDSSTYKGKNTNIKIEHSDLLRGNRT